MSEPQSPPSAALVSTAPEDRTPTFLDLLLVLVRRRRLIVLTTVIVAFVLLAYNIAAKFIDPESPLNVLPDRYTATVTVLVRGDQQDYGAAAASLLSQIPSGGLADFTSLLAAGTNTDANLAQELLIGRTILDELAAHQGFITPLSQPDEKFQARRRLEQNLSVDYRPGSGVLEIAYEHIDPQQAFAGLFFLRCPYSATAFICSRWKE